MKTLGRDRPWGGPAGALPCPAAFGRIGAMPMPPLSHHEIVALVEPFARAGRQVDLAASQRLERRIAFRPREHAAAGTLPPLRETLQLENPRAGSFALTRTLTAPDGQRAELVAHGDDAGALLARVDAVAAAAQWRCGSGWSLAFSHTLAAPTRLVPATAPQLVRASARAGALGFTVTVSTVRGIAAEIELPEAAHFTPPEDLFAVLGWSWTPLRRVRQGWQGALLLRGHGAARTADAEAKLERTVRHLAATLAEAPARFHERHVGARWVVVLRRLIPLFATAALVAGAAGVSQLQMAQNSVWRMLIFHAPPLLLAALFCLRELPRFEFPPLPRRLDAPAWHADEGSACTATR